MQYNYLFLKRHLFLFLPLLLFGKILFAQNPTDTIHPPKVDSVKPKVQADSLKQPKRIFKNPVTDTLGKTIGVDSNLQKPSQDTSWTSIKDSTLFQNTKQVDSSTLQLNSSPEKFSGTSKKAFAGKEVLFYSLIILLLLFALLRNLFPKYFGDLFRLFFRTTLKQRQIKEQLMQTTLPSLIFNMFFVITAALYIDLLLHHFNLLPVQNFWLLFFYCLAALSIIYLLKYVGLKISGWLFNMRDAADSYIFIVFIVNKMAGIYLVPFLILLAFTEGELYHIFLILSWVGILMLLIYRFILTFSAVHNQIRVNLFHFFLYLCAFEIAPVLLIYKLLLYFFN